MAESTTSAFRASLWWLRAFSIAIGVPVLIAAGGPSIQDQETPDWLRYGPGVANHPVGVVPWSGRELDAGRVAGQALVMSLVEPVTGSLVARLVHQADGVGVEGKHPLRGS